MAFDEQKVHLLDLPPDILNKIMLLLDWDSLSDFANTCEKLGQLLKNFQQVYKEAYEWKRLENLCGWLQTEDIPENRPQFCARRESGGLYADPYFYYHYSSDSDSFEEHWDNYDDEYVRDKYGRYRANPYYHEYDGD